MRQISHIIATLEAWQQQHGDIEVLKSDMENGLIPLNPVEYRRVMTDPQRGITELLSHDDRQQAQELVNSHNVTMVETQSLIDSWEMEDVGFRNLFPNPQSVMDQYMDTYWRAHAILQSWDRSPSVLVL